jgi:hypothetical protein
MKKAAVLGLAIFCVSACGGAVTGPGEGNSTDRAGTIAPDASSDAGAARSGAGSSDASVSSSPDAGASSSTDASASRSMDAGASSSMDAGVSDSGSPSSLAPFEFVVDGVVQTPMACPYDHWEFRSACVDDASAPNTVCGDSTMLVNTGDVPLAYLAQALWTFAVHYEPGVASAPSQLVGVLAPGAQVDLSSVYAGGIVALVGRRRPFSDATAEDEGAIAWPPGVESGGATEMYVAEITVPSWSPGCTTVTQAW